MNLDRFDGKKPKKLLLTDELLLFELNKIIKSSTENFENYEYSKAKNDVEQFFWKVFADNYLEIVKKRIYNGNDEEKNSAKYVLYHGLLSIVKLMSPITPFVCEEIYQNHFRKNENDKSVHISTWPPEFKVSKVNEKIWSLMINIIGKVRQEKSLAQKSMKAEIVLTLEKKDVESLKDVLDDLKSVANAREIKEGKFKVEFLD